jgi:hypothetical protein
MRHHAVPTLTSARNVLQPLAVVKRLPYVLFSLALAPLAYGQTVNTRTAESSGTLDRILDLVLPVSASSPARPERLNEFVLATVGPVPLIGELAGAGIGQWADAPKEWGQGWGAFGKRYGSNLAYNGIRQTITYGGSLALDEDTRYFASPKSGFWPRTRHALVSTFTARHPDGSNQFSISGTAGVIGASAISSVWGPDSWKGPGNIAKNAGISFASTAATNLIREFLPDIFHRTRK